MSFLLLYGDHVALDIWNKELNFLFNYNVYIYIDIEHICIMSTNSFLQFCEIIKCINHDRKITRPIQP